MIFPNIGGFTMFSYSVELLAATRPAMALDTGVLGGNPGTAILGGG